MSDEPKQALKRLGRHLVLLAASAACLGLAGLAGPGNWRDGFIIAALIFSFVEFASLFAPIR
jgi:uncharacterized membrane protein YjjP (DUF1212 family)